jgi:hypothetical protein
VCGFQRNINTLTRGRFIQVYHSISTHGNGGVVGYDKADAVFLDASNVFEKLVEDSVVLARERLIQQDYLILPEERS